MDTKAVFLVVDDFDPMRKVTVNQLRAMGVSQILTANNGADALRTLRNQKVDIVLSDWNMPVLSGLDLFRAMRADAKLAETPFILITAEAERRQIEEAISAGVTELIIKPYSPLRLSTQVEKALSPAYRHRARAAAHSKKTTTNPGDTDGSVAAKTSAPPRSAVAEVGSAQLPSNALTEPPLLLIVDDAPDNLMLLSELFKSTYRVRLAQNGTKALAMCQGETPPDLVLLDVMMPGMSGFEVLEQMRQHPTSENIPVIFVTAKVQDTDRLRGLELGAVDYVTKPIDPTTLQLRVANFMRFVNVHRQLQASFDDMVELARLREHVEQITRHDLKGPLAAAMGIVQGCIAGDPAHAPDLQLAMQALHAALNTVSLSADLFKIETGAYVLQAQPLPILDLVSEVIGTHRPLWEPAGLKNQLKEAPDGQLPVLVQGEPSLCRVVLQNLFKNAWEASPEQGVVQVLWKADASHWTLELTNTGVIPERIRSRFFDKFVTDGKPKGTGLGTYSAQLLTKVQNGTLAFRVDDVAQTTTLIWSLPLA